MSIQLKIPARVVFYALAVAGTAAAAATILWEKTSPWVSPAVIALLLVAEAINATGGFYRSRQMRRAYEPRREFSAMEEVVVVLLIMANVFVTVYRLLAPAGS